MVLIINELKVMYKKLIQKKLIFFFAAAILFIINVSQGLAAENYKYLNMWPKINQEKYFLKLKDIASVEDKFYVVDGKYIKALSNKGELLNKWEIKNADIFTDYLMITANKKYVYVALDFSIQKFTTDGMLLAEWGNSDDVSTDGEEKVEFGSITDIATDSQGNVYVLDNTETIMILNSKGKLIKKWKVADFSVGIAIDINNNILVSNYGDNTITKYNNQGEILKSWIFDGEMTDNITTDFLGNIYVNDSRSQKVYKYDSNGLMQGSWYSPCFTIAKLETDAKGFIYIIDRGYIQKYDASGNLIEEWGNGGSLDGRFSVPIGVVADSKENIFVLDRFNHRVQKFDSKGNFLSKWGQRGSKAGELFFPEDIAADKQGNIYVADTGNHRIQKFTNSGKFLMQWGKQGNGNGQFADIVDLHIDSKGNIYVVDRGNNNIQKFNPKGQFVQKWTNFGKGKNLNLPHGITIDSQDNVYINNLNGVYKISSQGKYLAFWSFQSRVKQRDEAMYFPYTNLAVDSKNNIYVADQIYDYIEKYSPQGKSLGKWGKRGLGSNEFQRINDITISKGNKLYVVDDVLSRVQVFQIP